MQEFKFKNKSVRDLAWAISTPPIMRLKAQSCDWPKSSWFENAHQETLNLLLKFDQDPSELDDLLEKQKDKRLGKYFETLWFYWFSQHPRYDVLAQNLQIIIDGETLGEIDFILYDKENKKIMHWEVAIKFYLGLDDTFQMKNWHGPNLKDRLDLKVNHLVNKQTRISHDPIVADWLNQLGFKIEQCAVILKGRLYYHYSQFCNEKSDRKKYLNRPKEKLETAETVLSPKSSEANHLRGKWFRQSEFTDYFAESEHFRPLLNGGWLESLPTDGIDKFVSKQELFETLSKNELRLPLHLQVFRGSGATEKIFLVNENWSKSE